MSFFIHLRCTCFRTLFRSFPADFTSNLRAWKSLSLNLRRNVSKRSLGAGCAALFNVTLFRLSFRRQLFFTVLCEPLEDTAIHLEAPSQITWNSIDLIKVLWFEWFNLSCAVVAVLLAAFMNISIPVYLGEFVNVLSHFTVDGAEFRQLYSPTLMLLTTYIIQSLATFSYIALLGAAGERIARNLRDALFVKLIYRKMAYFDSHNSGKLVDSILSDVQSFKSSFKQVISHGLRGVTQIVGSVYTLYVISPTLTLAMLVSLPCVFLVGSLMGSELRHLSKEAQLQSSLLACVAEESFTHIRSVKSLALEEVQHERFCAGDARLLQVNTKLGCGIGVFQGLSNLALNGITLGALLLGGHLVLRNELTPGHLMSFLVTTQTVQRSLAQLSMLYGHVVRGSVAFTNIFNLLHSSGASDISSLNSESRLLFEKLLRQWCQPHRSPTLQFDAVSFSYPTRPDAPVLDSLNMSVPAGKVTALVGKSGAGKSTIVSLLERFYEPSGGTILLDDHGLHEFPLSFLRSQLIGYISQEPQIFNTSIRENIRFGRPSATDDEVVAAARLANAHEFIVSQLPQGYDTPVGQGSDTVAGLSGGQRQRIAIARAILKNAPILILDEATSALDAESEAQVQDALKTVMKGRTVLVIAHRLSTVREADNILVMDSGKIVEQGTHRELVGKRGVYYELVQRQESGTLPPV
ncbi:unnamed protein product [Dicrocoelium dendriticum]|nr:unnamed protein product [Dicrocoelium dendriticum]